jgi:hypothetical protein
MFLAATSVSVMGVAGSAATHRRSLRCQEINQLLHYFPPFQNLIEPGIVECVYEKLCTLRSGQHIMGHLSKNTAAKDSLQRLKNIQKPFNHFLFTALDFSKR